MRVNRLLPQHGMPSGFSTAPGPRAEHRREGGLSFLSAGAGNIAENAGAPISIDPSTRFKSGEPEKPNDLAGACRVERRVRLDALMQDPILHWVKKAMAALGFGYKNEW